MSGRKPLVLGDDALPQNLQSQDDLDIPLGERVGTLEENFNLLVKILMMNGIDLPEEITDGQ